ncbi:hypothetical protein [Streptomyces mexicanus]|jgi:hypothetical protein|uniref:hypothetical protein n=1 Tax=Streptomyces mexicanus TaxID=178566 RepID=UPI00191DAD12|nr:hypothetical protein [Streptomyces mexicanus]
MLSTKTTVQPYPPGTQWTFTTRRGTYTQDAELILCPEPDGSSMSDDYLPDEISAHELWRMWVDRYAVTYHQRYPEKYRVGEVPIFWTVTSGSGVFEQAPHSAHGLSEDFLTHYTHPVHAETGERVNWMRLPVMDRGWNGTTADKGGFIQEATGWKPSPLQPTMDFIQIGRAAGLYVPDLG